MVVVVVGACGLQLLRDSGGNRASGRGLGPERVRDDLLGSLTELCPRQSHGTHDCARQNLRRNPLHLRRQTEIHQRATGVQADLD